MKAASSAPETQERFMDFVFGLKGWTAEMWKGIKREAMSERQRKEAKDKKSVIKSVRGKRQRKVGSSCTSVKEY